MWVLFLYTLVIYPPPSSLLISTSRNGICYSFLSSIVNSINVLRVFRYVRNLPSFGLPCDQMMNVSSTYWTQKEGLSSAWSMASDSKCSMNKLAITGDGESMATSFVCSYDFSLNWKYIDFKQNSVNWYIVCHDSVVLSSSPSSNLSFASTTSIASSTGTLFFYKEFMP